MFLQRIKAVFFRHLLPLPRDPARLIDLVYWPFFDILTFGFIGFWAQQHTNNEFALRLVSGLVLWQIVSRAHYEITYGFVEEMWANNIITLFSSPLTFFEWFIGMLSISFLKSIFSFFFSISIVWLLYGTNILTLGWQLVDFFITLIICGWWLSLITLSVILWVGRRAETLVWVMGWTLAPLCGAFYPTSVLPGWAQRLSMVFPQTYLFQNLDMIIITNQTDNNLWYTTIGLIIVFSAIGCLLIYCAFRYSKNLGFTHLSND